MPLLSPKWVSTKLKQLQRGNAKTKEIRAQPTKRSGETTGPKITGEKTDATCAGKDCNGRVLGVYGPGASANVAGHRKTSRAKKKDVKAAAQISKVNMQTRDRNKDVTVEKKMLPFCSAPWFLVG